MGEEKKVDQTFFSSEYGSSYRLREGAFNEDSGLSAGSTLIARQSGTYGANASRGDTTIVSLGTAGDAEGSGGSTDKTNLLTEKIRQKKQGM